MYKAALIANQESYASFMIFFQENKNKIEKLASKKIEIDYILNTSSAADLNFDQKIFSGPKSIKAAASFDEILLNSKVDIIIELNPTEESKDYIIKSLKNDKNIITINKKVIAENLKEIKSLEKKYQGRVYFSAAFSPLPLKTLIDNFYVLDEIEAVDAILSSTTNYILTEMEKNTISMKETIEQAKKASYTEENTEFNLTGLDSLYKIVLLSNLFYNIDVDPNIVKVKGIKGITSFDLIYAEELGYKIKLISSVKKEKNKLYIGVRPNLIKKNSYLASANENSNAVEIISNYNSKITLKAKNTDSALFNLISVDLINAVKDKNNNKMKLELEKKPENVFDLYNNKKRSFYIRLQLEKDEEIIENIKNIFSEKNLADLILHDNLTETPLLPVIIMTKKIKEKDLEIILREIEKLKGVLTVNNIIPVKAE
jgi:homoserine dehydrogenase